MNLQLNNCAGSRTAIVAQPSTAPVISLTDDVLSSTSASAYQWYLNGTALANKTQKNRYCYYIRNIYS